MTTNLYIPRLRAHKLSAAVGSGKTRAAVAWIASPATARTNVLYVAPTRQLLAQTEHSIREALAATEGQHVRNVHRIVSDPNEPGRGSVKVDALQALNDAEEGDGLVQLLTTQTFLAVLAGIRHPERWSVILDEAFAPASFQTFQLGADALRGWEHFSELFEVDPAQGHRIVPKQGRQTAVEAVARGDFSSAGDRFKSLQEVAQGVANKAIRCELVMTDGARAVLEGTTPKKRGKEVTGTALQFASYVDPQAFAGFREVLFLSALFEQTILYHLWTKALGVSFEEHPKFPAHMLRDTHAEQGRFLAVGHLLHKDDRASIDTLQRDALSGQPGPGAPRARVIDHLIQTAAGHFGDEPFLLQANERFGYSAGSALLPRRAVRIPTMSHGLNDFQHCDNVAALAVTNPNPQQLQWVRSRTGMDAREVTQAYRIHATYQALGRCSIRKAEQTSTPKVALVVGYDDARFIHELFPGSHWLGQVGTMPPLDGLRPERGHDGAALGKTDALSNAIVKALAEIPEDRRAVSCRALKAMVEARIQDRPAPLACGAVGHVGVAPQTWKRALSQACIRGSGWQKQGQKLHRITAEHYGFKVDHAAGAACPG